MTPDVPGRQPDRGPGLAWIRRRTNVEDLLDDGIENGSDIGAAPAEPDEPHSPGEEAALRTRDETIATLRAERAAVEASTRRRAFSPYGLLLGLAIAAGGTWLIVDPVDMRVLHDRYRYLPSFREHVTPARSRLYGTAGLVGGLFLVGYALRRPS